MVLFFFTLDHIFQKKKKSRVFIYTNNKQNKRVNKKKNNKFLEPEIIEKERTKLFLVAKTQEKKKHTRTKRLCLVYIFFCSNTMVVYKTL